MGYREAARELPPTESDVHWRIQVARAANGLFWALIAQTVLACLTSVAPKLLGALGFVVGAVATWFTWQLTAPRPISETRARRRLRQWLRGIAVLSLVQGGWTHTGLLVNGLGVPFVLDIAFTVLGFLYLRELFREFAAEQWVRQSSRLARRYAVRIGLMYVTALGLGLVSYSSHRIGVIAGDVASTVLVGVVFVTWLSLLKVGYDALKLLRQLRATLHIEEHQWWFKPGVGWASLAIARDGAEVIETTGERTLLNDRREACGWLEEGDYVPEARALAESMVLDAPPAISATTAPNIEDREDRGEAPKRRRRKRHRVQVEAAPPADADISVDTEDAVSDVEPQRAKVETTER